MDPISSIMARIEEKYIPRDLDPVSTTGMQKRAEPGSECAFCASYKTFREMAAHCSKISEEFSSDHCPELKNKWQHVLKAAGAYERFFDANCTAIERRGIPTKIRLQASKIMRYIGTLDSNIRDGSGLILAGPPGTMKTTFGVAILQQALLQGYSARKILMQSLLDEIFTLKAKNLDDWLQFEKQLREAKLLVIDELGKHKSEGWVMTKFEAIVSERHERRRSTIFITNLTPDEMKGMYSEGVIDRFNHCNELITFTGNSVRIQGD